MTATTRSSSRRPTEARDEADPDPRRRRRRHADREPSQSSACAARSSPAKSTITVVDQTGEHTYQPGFMYIAMGGERAERLQRPERSLLDKRVGLVWGSRRIDESTQTVPSPTASIGYDYLVLATGSRIVPEEIAHFATQAHHFYTADAALELRRALDAFTGGRIVVGIAGMPYKCPPAPLEVAFLIEAELRERGLRERSEFHFCSPIGRAFTIESVSEMATPDPRAKAIELHTFFNVETIDAERHVVQSLEGEELPYDLLILVPPHKGQQFLIDCGLAPAPGGWLPTDRATLQVGGRAGRLRPRRCDGSAAIEGRLDGTLRGAGRHRAARRRDRGPRDRPPTRRLPRQGHVLLRDRRRQGHPAAVRLRRIRPPRRSQTGSGTWARSCSTRRTGIRSPRVACRSAEARALALQFFADLARLPLWAQDPPELATYSPWATRPIPQPPSVNTNHRLSGLVARL